jgi:hypothetical protein
MGSLNTIGGPTDLLCRAIGSVAPLRQLPELERLMLRPVFRDEDANLGPSQRWLDRDWELRLASVNGTIYKVALEAKAADRDDAVELTAVVYSALQKNLGTPSPESDGIFVWDGDDGNAVLQLASVGGDRRIMVFFTSNIRRGFVVR